MLKIDRIGLKDGAALRHARDHRAGKAVALGFHYPARLPASGCLPSNDNAIGRPSFSGHPCRTFYQEAAVSIRDRLLENTGSIIGRGRRGVHCLRQRLADETRPERVMFGGDWPVCTMTATYRQWVEALKTIVRQRPAEEQRKLFHDNAVRFYGLK